MDPQIQFYMEQKKLKTRQMKVDELRAATAEFMHRLYKRGLTTTCTQILGALCNRCKSNAGEQPKRSEQRNFVQVCSEPVLLKSANSLLGTKSEKVMRF